MLLPGVSPRDSRHSYRQVKITTGVNPKLGARFTISVDYISPGVLYTGLAGRSGQVTSVDFSPRAFPKAVVCPKTLKGWSHGSLNVSTCALGRTYALGLQLHGGNKENYQ